MTTTPTQEQVDEVRDLVLAVASLFNQRSTGIVINALISLMANVITYQATNEDEAVGLALQVAVTLLDPFGVDLRGNEDEDDEPTARKDVLQ